MPFPARRRLGARPLSWWRHAVVAAGAIAFPACFLGGKGKGDPCMCSNPPDASSEIPFDASEDWPAIDLDAQVTIDGTRSVTGQACGDQPPCEPPFETCLSSASMAQCCHVASGEAGTLVESCRPSSVE